MSVLLRKSLNSPPWEEWSRVNGIEVGQNPPQPITQPNLHYKHI